MTPLQDTFDTHFRIVGQVIGGSDIVFCAWNMDGKKWGGKKDGKRWNIYQGVWVFKPRYNPVT